MAMPMSRRRFTVEEYERMGQAGILGEDDRVELLEGEIVEMTPIGPLHAGGVKRLIRLFTSRLGGAAVVSAQDPVRLTLYSEPQPDVALLRPRDDFYALRHPGADDVLLAVEVSVSTALFDRSVKMPLYARAGVRQAWLVDLDAGVVEVYRLAAGAREYGPPEQCSGEHVVAVDAFPDLVITAAEILGQLSS